MPEAISNPRPAPGRSLWAALGPSFVVLGSVVGSGELINTPVQAAKFGFILLWAVLLACVLRVFLQVEIGRHCLVHRRTTIEALNTCPGPRWRGTSWVGLLYLGIYPLLLLPTVGMIGALAALCTSMLPLANSESISNNLWATLLVVVTWAALSGGVYKHLERLVVLLVAIFSLTTIGAVLLIQGTTFRVTESEFLSGLKFSLGDDRSLALYAIVAFLGGLGVTANELFMYPYWIQEKGYGADLEHHEGEAWIAVARRWIRSIWFDVGLATLLATLVTAAFYLLGAAVLHRQGLMPEGTNVVRQIGQVYVDSYGPWSLKFFYFGAVCTMWSTMIVAIAASSRMVSDLLGSLGYIDRRNAIGTRRVHQIAQPLLLLGVLVTFLALQMSPANIVILGHFLSGGFAMPLIMLGICWIAFHTDQRVRMSKLTAVLLLFTSAVVLACAIVGVAHKLLGGEERPPVTPEGKRLRSTASTTHQAPEPFAVKALVKKHAQEGLWLEDVPEPEIGINDVLIRVHKTGICGTDVHIYNWDAWASKTIPVPMVVGHEFVGEVVEVGSNVVGFKPGYVVSGEGHVVCGRCRNCMAGRRHLCKETRGVGVNRPGAFAEYISLPMTNVWRHAAGIDPDVAAIFDPLGNAVHTALSFDVLGEDVLITGAGPIGIMAAAVVRQAGARHVVITDVNPYRLDLAKKMNVTRAVDVRSIKLADVQMELGMAEGFDVGLEMSGNPAAFRDMLANMCHGGKIAMLGIPAEEMPIDWNLVVFNMLTIKGIYGREMYETWYKMTVLIESGMDITPVITHRLSYRDFEEGFAAMRSGQSGKVVLDWQI